MTKTVGNTVCRQIEALKKGPFSVQMRKSALLRALIKAFKGWFADNRDGIISGHGNYSNTGMQSVNLGDHFIRVRQKVRQFAVYTDLSTTRISTCQ